MRRLLAKLSYLWAPRVASELRKRWAVLRNPGADVSFGRGVYLGPGFSLFCPEGGSFHVGDGVEFRRGFRCELHHGAVRIGTRTVFTYDVLVQCSSRIEIGERCMFGQASIVVDGNHRFRDLDRPMLEQGYDLTPITIADDAVVTSKCTIIADLGERAWIGANSVVTRPVPAFCVAGGVPARVLDYFGPPGGAPDELVARSDA